MITADQIRQFQKLLRKGVPDGEIKESMAKEGYSKEDIEKVFKPHHYDMRPWYLVFAILLFLVGGFLFITEKYWIVLVLSGLLFLQYFNEVKRLKNLKRED